MTTPDCCDPPSGGSHLLPWRQALDLMVRSLGPLGDIEEVPTAAGLGRVLAAPVDSTIEVPGWDNSAMDGYACRHADLAAQGGRLRVSRRIPAGTTGTHLEPGTAARIFTGAPIPPGADTVVMQEVCQVSGDQVLIPLDVQAGANIRRIGEDIRAGRQVIATGTRLGPQHLGLAAAVGVARLGVYRRLRVAVLASGNELVMPGEPLGPGQIYNSNRFTLLGLLQGLGCEILDLGIAPDTREATIAALGRGAREADLIVASGGVSVGEEDHLKPAVEQLGHLDLWRLAIRPGKPVAYGRVGNTPFFGSPGNPVSLFVTFCLLARPLVLRLQGVSADPQPIAYPLRAGFDWLKPDKRTEFHRARLQRGEDGEPEVAVFPSRSSAALSSVAWAEGLVELPPGRVIRRGELVSYLPFSALLG